MTNTEPHVQQLVIGLYRETGIGSQDLAGVGFCASTLVILVFFMKIFIQENWFKILGIILLLIALGNLTMGYYVFLRWAIMLISAYLACWFYNPPSGQKNINWVWIFSIMVVLFNPIFPFYFSKNTWQTLDVIVSIILFVNIIKQ